MLSPRSRPPVRILSFASYRSRPLFSRSSISVVNFFIYLLSSIVIVNLCCQSLLSISVVNLCPFLISLSVSLGTVSLSGPVVKITVVCQHSGHSSCQSHHPRCCFSHGQRSHRSFRRSSHCNLTIWLRQLVVVHLIIHLETRRLSRRRPPSVSRCSSRIFAVSEVSMHLAVHSAVSLCQSFNILFASLLSRCSSCWSSRYESILLSISLFPWQIHWKGKRLQAATKVHLAILAIGKFIGFMGFVFNRQRDLETLRHQGFTMKGPLW